MDRMINRTTICCNKEMIEVGVVDLCNMNVNSVSRWICSECGSIIDLIDFSLDDEELVDLIENEINEHPEFKNLLNSLKEEEIYQMTYSEEEKQENFCN